MTIIDVRCRVTFGESGHAFRKYLGGRAPAALREGTPEAFFRELDRAGVTAAVPVAGSDQGMTLAGKRIHSRHVSNDEQARLQSEYPGRVIGVAGIDVGGHFHDPIQELSRCVNQLGLRAAAIEPGREPLLAPHPADPRLYSFYGHAQSLGVPLFIMVSGQRGGRNIDYGHPRWIDQVAGDFPELRIVCAHGCYPYVREMIVVAMRHANVWVAPDMYTTRLGRDDWVQAVNSRWLAPRFLFGSNFPAVPDLRAFVREFLACGWHRGRLDQILYRNAIDILGLRDEPPFSAVYRQPDVYSRAWPVKQVFAIARRLLRRSARGNS